MPVHSQTNQSIVTIRTKIAEDYSFNAANSYVEVKDISFFRFLHIVNTTDQRVIYDPTDAALGGTVYGNIIQLEYDTSNMEDSDDLLVVYESNSLQEKSTEQLLENILEQLKIQNVILGQILG